MPENTIMILLNKVKITGAGTKHILHYHPPYTVQINFTNVGGSVTALEVQLEGSLDGVNFISLHDNEVPYVFTAADLAAGFAMYHIQNRKVQEVRGNLTTLTQTGTTEVTQYLMGSVKDNG